MPQRLALLVATYRYQDAGLRQLTAPGHDAEALAEVLRDPEIADFDVTILVNEPHHIVGRTIGEFYRNRRREDLTLLYFTGHGLKDDEGRLYLAMTNTTRDNLLFTALPAQQIDYAMDSCSSQQNVLVLDCCYSGAFPAGRAAKADAEVHTLEKFQGKGRVVLTASDATQYSFEGNHIIGEGTRSVFTRFLVEGLSTGEADLDSDGDISLDELYSYVYDRVIEEMPQQRPKKQENVEGRIVIARNIHWRPPASVRDAIESTFVRDRLAVLKGLAQLHRDGNDLVRAEVVNQARRLVDDDNEAVAAAAMELLTALTPEQARPEPEESRWVPAVSSRPQQAEEQDKKQVVTSPTLMLSADDTTARSGPLEREAWADLYPAQAGGTPKKQVPQRARQETGEQTRRQANGRATPSWLSQLARRRHEEQVRRQAEQYTTDTSVGGHLGLAESWGAAAHSPRALRSGRSIWVLTTVVVSAFITLLLLLFTDLFVVGPRPLALPNVVGEPVGNAEQRLNAAGFETEVRPVESTPQDLGRVVAMNPAGQALPETTIRLDVGTEQAEVEVPNLIGLDRAQAQAFLQQVGLVLSPDHRQQVVRDDNDIGRVVAQDPPAGRRLAKAKSVGITVGVPPETVAVPDVVGTHIDQAQRNITGTRLTPQIQEVDSVAPKGQVLKQNPAGGTNVKVGTTVTLAVSRG